jgi:probable rRNA maturation factor
VILVKNTQRTFDVDVAVIKKMVQILLDELGYSDFDIGIWFTTNKTIAQYNTKYRGKKGPTDILSFPYHAALKAGQTIKTTDPDDCNLGDIIISLEFIHKADQWRDVKERDRLPILLVHGICHLVGYDHENDKDFAVMRKKEQVLLAKLN